MRFLMRLLFFLMGLFGVLLSMFAQWTFIEDIENTPYLPYEMKVDYILHNANTVAFPILLMSALVWGLLALCIHRKIL